MMPSDVRCLRALLLGAVIACAWTAHAFGAAHFTGTLDGSQVVPPIATAATGTGSFELNEAGTALAFQITVQGLSGPITAAHFHNGAPGATGPVVRDLSGDFSGRTASGFWTNTDANPLTPALLAELLAGNIYVNVHTAANPAGEIRARLELTAGIQMGAALDGAQVSPPIATAATGTAALTLTAAGLRYDVTVEGLSGPITVAHFHRGAPGVNGPVVRDVSGDFVGNSASGIWTASDASPLTPALIQDLLDGQIYLNVHTAANPGGEIRGQVETRFGSGYSATLDGTQESPPVLTPATGTANASLDRERTELRFEVTVEGLSGPITGAHIHNEAPGVNGPVVRDLTAAFTGSTASGAWSSTDASPLTPALVAELLAGRLYVNVHTAANPAGEIRGQLRVATGIGFSSALDGGQASPPNASPATGTGSYTLAGDGLAFDVTYEGLLGAFSVAHFHIAPPGVAGPIARDVTGDFTGNTASGTWSPTDAQALTPARIQELLDGLVYLNVHSTLFPGGEIRGQLGLPEVVGIAAGASPSRRFALAQNAPNPFNPTTWIRYQVPTGTRVKLGVFDTSGRQVATLVDGVRGGPQLERFEAHGLASGVYYYRLETDQFVETRKLVLAK